MLAALLIGGIALSGAAAAAENIHDGTLKDPQTGEPVTSINGGEKTKIKYGYEVDNVSSTGESVLLYLVFPDEVNTTRGLESPGSFQINVTCKCGGVPESISKSDGPDPADPDGDGVQEAIQFGIQPSKEGPIDLIVNVTGPATYPNVTSDTTYDLQADMDESISSGQDAKAVFETVTVTADGGSGGSDGDSPNDGGESTEGPDISNFDATAENGMITVTFDSDETLADIEVDVRGAEDATLTTEDFDGNQYEGYTGTYRAGTDGDYTFELVTAEGSSGENGASGGDHTETVAVSGTGDGSADDGSGEATPTLTDGTSDGDTSGDDGTAGDDETSGDDTPTDDNGTADGSPTATDDGATDDGGTGGDDGTGDDGTSGDDAEDDTPTPTDGADDDDAAGDDDDEDDAGDDADDGSGTPTENQPGFGAVVALVALIASVLLFHRRR